MSAKSDWPKRDGGFPRPAPMIDGPEKERGKFITNDNPKLTPKKKKKAGK
jgi:hypothetical protein